MSNVSDKSKGTPNPCGCSIKNSPKPPKFLEPNIEAEASEVRDEDNKENEEKKN